MQYIFFKQGFKEGNLISESIFKMLYGYYINAKEMEFEIKNKEKEVLIQKNQKNLSNTNENQKIFDKSNINLNLDIFKIKTVVKNTDYRWNNAHFFLKIPTYILYFFQKYKR